MAEICRLCASFKTIDLLVPLYDPVHSIPAKVEQCCGIIITEEREMPQTVCKGCLDSLNKSFTFAEAVTMAQKTLRTAIASRTITSTPASQPIVQVNQQYGSTVKLDQRDVSADSSQATPFEF